MTLHPAATITAANISYRTVGARWLKILYVQIVR
jgi:hypothetical protein